MAILRNFFLPNDFIEGIVFDPGNKGDPLGRPPAKQGIVIIGAVIHDNRSGSKMELRNRFHVRDLTLRDDGIGGKIAIMIQKQMQFDGPLGSTELCRVKQGDREIGDGRVQNHQLILESELSLPLNLVLASIQQLHKELLVE